MLDFAVKHKRALEKISGDRTWGLRKFELADEEWAIAEQLRNVLEVCGVTQHHVTRCLSQRVCRLSQRICLLDLEACYALFLSKNTCSGNRHPRHGPHRRIFRHKIPRHVPRAADPCSSLACKADT
jgi:hypothetical protein